MLKAIINLRKWRWGVIQEGKGFAINNTYTVPNNENININVTKILVSMCLKDKGKKDRG